MTTPAQHALWIGTYPAENAGGGTGEGVWGLTVTDEGRFGEPVLAVTTPVPSFVALHPSGRTLYAVDESSAGAVTAFAVVADGALADPVTIASGGDSPCHLLALDDVLWIANYMDGTAAAVPLVPATGAFAADAVTRHPGQGSGPQADRQEGPHAHFAALVDGHVLVVDLGADVVRRYPLDDGQAAGDTAAHLAPGTGPRHLVRLPSGALVVAGELDDALHVLAPAGDGWAPASAVPASASAAPDGSASLPAHVTLTGDLVLLGVRGADVLAVHRVRETGGADTLEHLGDIPLGAGAWPRHHTVVGQAPDGRLLVVVANQGTHELASVLVDPVTGAGVVVDTLTFPTPPSCVLVSDARE